MLHLLSSVVLVLVACGVYWRRNRSAHLAFMVSAFLADLSLVLYIELTRKAVERLGEPMPTILAVHIGASVLVLLLYLVQIGLGIALFKGRTITKSIHARVGITFCFFRLMNYVTSFMIQG